MNQNELKEKVAAVAQTSSAFQKIGAYILDNWSGMCLMTATDVAKKVNISQGSVTRFCNVLGFNGYNEFIRNLKESYFDSLSAPDRLRNIKSHNLNLEQLLENEKNNLSSIPSIIETKDFQSIVTEMIESKKIILLSSRISATLLDVIHYSLCKIRDNVSVVKPGSCEWNKLEINSPEGIFIFVISFPRYHTELVEKVKRLSEIGFELGLLTNSIISPMVPFVKYHIEVPISSTSMFDIYGAPVVLLNYMIMEMANRIPNLEERMNRIETYEKEWNIYY